ncbi:MAG: hypothetical protein V3T02_08135 [Alphaproteobacteria bacterium]
MPGFMRNTTHHLAVICFAFALAVAPGVAFAEGRDDDPVETADPGYAAAVKAVKAGSYPAAIPLLEKAAAKRNM